MHVLTSLQEMSNGWITFPRVVRFCSLEDACVVDEECSEQLLIDSSLFSVQVGYSNCESFHNVLLFNMPCGVQYHGCLLSHSRDIRIFEWTFMKCPNIIRKEPVHGPLEPVHSCGVFPYQYFDCKHQTPYLLAILWFLGYIFLEIGSMFFRFAVAHSKWICKAVFPAESRFHSKLPSLLFWV